MAHWRSKHREWNRLIGEQIFLRREQKGITQKELAKAVGLYGNGGISQMESGTAAPSGHTLFKIANVLGCKLDDFYCSVSLE